jgi:hypothetical protein
MSIPLLSLMAVATILLLLATSDDAAADGPSDVVLINPRTDYWSADNNMTFKWGILPAHPQIEFHLMFWYPNGTVGANVTGTNETSYHAGFLPDAGGYNWTVVVNYTAGGENWTARSNVSVFGIDTVPPENPTHAMMGNGTAKRGVWQSNETDVVIYVYGAHDNLSGVEAYQFYWGPDPKGKVVGGTYGNRFFLGTTPECIWYFRVQAVDKAWNRAELITLYVHMHDALPPLTPDVVEQLNGTTESDVWQNDVHTPRFRWEEPWDQTSGVKGYRVYFGPDSNGTSGTFLTGRTWEPGSVTDGSYFMRISPVDVAGNAAPWHTRYVLRYDRTPPGIVKIACTANNLSSTGDATFIWTEPWDLSGIRRYRYRLNDGAGTWVTSPTASFEKMRDRHHVFGVAAQDGAGNMGEWTFVNLTVDTTPPSGSVAFDVADFATNVTVPLMITVEEDTSGVVAMRFSPDGIVWRGWEPFRSTAMFTLPEGDGIKAVQLQLRDFAGHVSVERMVDSVLLDTTVPVGELLINGGALHTTSRAVTLNVTAEDANGIVGMRLAEDTKGWGDVLEPFNDLAYTLAPGEGERTISVMLIDGAGLSSIVSTTILLDTEPPTGAVLIDGGDEYSYSGTVNLSITAEDATSGVVEMRFSWNGTSWSPWENFTEERPLYDLEPGDGERTVHVQLRDGVSLVSQVTIVDTVRVDTVGPTGSVVIEGGQDTTRFYTVDLTLSATDANGVVDMRLSWDGETWTDWEPFKTSRTMSMPGEDGLNTVYVEFRDSSGRVSEVPATDSIEYERIGNLTIALVALVLVVAVLAAMAFVRKRR